MNLKTWKSPRIIAGLVGVSILTGSFIFYFSTTATAAYIVVNNEKIGLTPSISSGKKLVQETLEEYGQTVNQIAQTKQTIEWIVNSKLDNFLKCLVFEFQWAKIA